MSHPEITAVEAYKDALIRHFALLRTHTSLGDSVLEVFQMYVADGITKVYADFEKRFNESADEMARVKGGEINARNNSNY